MTLLPSTRLQDCCVGFHLPLPLLDSHLELKKDKNEILSQRTRMSNTTRGERNIPWGSDQHAECLYKMKRLTCSFCFVHSGGEAGAAETHSVESQDSEDVVDEGGELEVGCSFGSRDLGEIMPVTTVVEGVFILDQKHCVATDDTMHHRTIYVNAYLDYCNNKIKNMMVKYW